MIHRYLALAAFSLFVQAGAHASPASETLGRCLTDNTSGKERKDLAKWIFVGMSAHPEIGAIARPGKEAVEATQRQAGVLFTRLIVEACPKEMQAVIRSEGSEGMRLAFEYLGKMAMQELTSHPQVSAAIGGFERYVDKPRIERALKE